MREWLQIARRGVTLLLALLLWALAASIDAAHAAANSGVLDSRITAALLNPDVSMKQSDLDSAEFLLRQAVRLAPTDAQLRTQLGLVWLRTGDTLAALRELRQARHDNGPEEVIIPAIIRTLLARSESEQLLMEFPPPPPDQQQKFTPDILMGRAMALQSRGSFDEAKEEAERSLRLRRDLRNLLARANLAEQQRDKKLARQLVDQATKLSPDSEGALILKVSLLLEDGEAPKALAAVNDFVQHVPDRPNIAALHVEVLLALKRDAEADMALDVLRNLTPDAPVVTYYEALLAARAKNSGLAWATAQTLPTGFIIARRGIAMAIADLALANDNSETATAILLAFISRHPEADEVRFPLAALQLGHHNAEAALKTLEPIGKSTNPAVQGLLAQTYFQLRRYADALGVFEHQHELVDRSDVLRQELGESLLEYGDTNQAIETLQQLDARHPGNWGVAAPLLDALIRNGDLDRVSGVIDRMGKAAGNSALASFYRGQVLGARGDLSAALAAYTKALAADAKFLPALFYRARLSVMLGETERARDDLRRILALDPANTPASLALAQIAFDNNNEAEVLSVLENARAVAPKDPTPLLALAKYRLGRRELGLAKAAIDTVLAQFRDEPEGLALQGQYWFASGDADRAIRSFQTLVANHPDSASAYIALAHALNLTKDHVPAIDAARSAVDLAPYSYEAQSLLAGLFLVRGWDDDALKVARAFNATHPGEQSDRLVADTFIKLKRTKEARSFLEQRLAANPSSHFVQRLSQLAIAEGDTAKGRRLLSDWVLKHPDDFGVHVTYASLLLLTGDTANARKEFEVLLKQRPQDPLVLNDLGWILQNEDLPRAISLLSLAEKVAPRVPDIADSLGWLKFRNHDGKGAVPILQHAYDLDSSNGEIAYHLAVALDSEGKRSEAKALLQSVIAKNIAFGDLGSARQLLARW